VSGCAPSLVADPAAELEKSAGRAPKPPAGEREGRLRRARAALEARGLDGLLAYGSAGVNADPIRYLAGYVHAFPGASSLLLLPVERDPVLLVDQPWHLPEAARMASVEDVRPCPSPGRGWLADEFRASLAGAATDAGLARARLGVFAGAMPAAHADALREALPAASLVPADGVWDDLVATPSDYDVEAIRATAAIADEGLRAAVEAAGDGVPEYEVCLSSLRRMSALGAEFLHGSGFSTHVNIGSYSEAISNVRPFLHTTRPLAAGEMFWLDLSASHAGCYTDTDRTVAIGEPSERQRELYEVTRAMYDVLLEHARPGTPGGVLWERAQRVAREAGYADFLNHVYLGHATGITTSARPFVAPGETAELRAGAFLNVEPGIFVPGVGAACIENTLAIGEQEAEAINAFPIDIQVVA
jgi:Xaa-Pro aminopeptidase